MSKKDEILGGTTLRVYLKLLALNRPVGIRELQRIMKFKSPSTSKYHLDKLLELGYVKRTEDGSYIAKKTKNNITFIYVHILGMLIPRFILYATFVTTFIIVYLMIDWPRVDFLAVIISVISSVILWIEGIRAYSMLKMLQKR